MDTFVTKEEITVLTEKTSIKEILFGKNVCGYSIENNGSKSVKVGINKEGSSGLMIAQNESRSSGSFDQLFDENSFLNFEFQDDGTDSNVTVTLYRVQGWSNVCEKFGKIS
ncbi:MAG: hypothetical protein AAF363_15730 [Bacteroidota bacterium]